MSAEIHNEGEVESLCYKTLPVSEPFAVNATDEVITLAPIVQTVSVNATVVQSPAYAQAAVAPSGERVAVSKKGKTVNLVKRSKRIKNAVAGLIILVSSTLVFLPFVFSMDAVSAGLVNVFAALPCLNFSGTFNAVQNLAAFFANSAAMGAAWKTAVPSFLIGAGLVFAAFNVLRAVAGILFSTREKKYAVNSLVTFGFFGIVVMLQFIGIDAIGLPKTDFVQEIVFGWKYSQSFVLLATALVNVIAAVICVFIVPKRDYDYYKR